MLQIKRVEKVKTLLSHSKLSVDKAIHQCGVEDINSFRKIFVREMGLSPAAYRKQLSR